MRLYQDQADREWQTWRQVCLQLDKLGLDVNTQDALAYAIKLWDEELVELQLVDQKDNKYHEKELERFRSMYEPYWIVKDK